jgi:7,8-dihydropterin-6-yl-methyl-4-(beta-D-ribofuranosyl)aminobenzene 5'-phosphate synthase
MIRETAYGQISHRFMKRGKGGQAMNVKITTLCENTVASGSGLMAQWGFSALVQVNKEKVLFDTGVGMSTILNALHLRVDLPGVSKIVLSHGHFDHTGGLKDVLTHLDSAEVYAHPDVFQSKYIVKKNKKPRYTGIPFKKEYLQSLGASFKLSKEPVQIGKNILTTGQIKRVTDFESISKNFRIKEDGEFVHDEMWDDQSLIIKTPKGLVVVLGCAHAGIINTLMHVREITGEGRFYSVIGGTHLIGAKSKRLNKTIEELKSFDIQKIAVSHCTGMPAMIALSHEFKDKIFSNNSGSVIEI